MCGIFGYIVKNGAYSHQKNIDVVKKLFLLSESRGKEASGFAIKKADKIIVHKNPYPAHVLLKSKAFNDAFTDRIQQDICFIGHSRLVTNGQEIFNTNNQPVVKDGMAVIHNGIIVNQSQLWNKYGIENRKTDLDSELIPFLIKTFIDEKHTLLKAITKTFSEIQGMTNIAVFFNDLENILLATNNGSLYFLFDNDKQAFIFASEVYILKTLISTLDLNDSFKPEEITHLQPNQSLLLNIRSLAFEQICFTNELLNIEFSSLTRAENEYKIEDVSQQDVNFQFAQPIITSIPKEFEQHYLQNKQRIENLRRCKCCILPETFPFIYFDEKGVCNYCQTYTKASLKGKESLENVINRYRNSKDKPNCIVAFSGGRDSSYSLHYIKNELKLNPLAYSYDWGMITDLARRNQARMCGKLGIEHILISADIRKKRANIQKNVLAWLKKPHLGTIPLFMAGDKQYFYYAQKLKEQNDIGLLIMGENLYEKTLFKTAFCGAKQDNSGYMAYHISTANKIRMAGFYMKQYLINPAYLNSSIIDTISAFFSYYAIKHDYLNLYSYIQWDEKLIDDVLLNEYDWETSPDTPTTWRIGDGTAAFYNYIYYTVAGFSENDTLRSNQIREGLITRDEAIQKSINENYPRWDSIKWYCDTISIDFEKTIKRINSIKKLY